MFSIYVFVKFCSLKDEVIGVCYLPATFLWLIRSSRKFNKSLIVLFMTHIFRLRLLDYVIVCDMIL